MASKKPVVAVIVDDVKHRIQNGDLSPGEQLPTTDKLTTHYETTARSVHSAIALLKASGHVVAHRGKGVFVADNLHLDASAEVRALQEARALVEAWADVYWRAGRDGTSAINAVLAGERVDEARERWRAIVADATSPGHAVVFTTAEMEFLAANEEVGRCEAAADEERTFETGMELGRSGHRRFVATGEFLRVALTPGFGGSRPAY